MPIIATAPAGAGDFARPTPGPVQAVCAFVLDLGYIWDEKHQKEKHTIGLFFELAELMEDGRPFMVSQRYTLSLGEKAILRRDLEGWRGRAFSEVELAGFDVERLVGINCYLNLVEVTAKNGKTYTNIKGIMPLPKGFAPLKVFNEKPPEWAIKAKAKNDAAKALRDAEDDKKPVVVLDDPPAPKVSTGGGASHTDGIDEPPFAPIWDCGA